MLDVANRPALKDFPQSGLVSLWDMINWKANRIQKPLCDLHADLAAVNALDQVSGGKVVSNSSLAKNKARIRRSLERLFQDIEPLDNQNINMTVGAAVELIERSQSWDAISQLLMMVLHTVQDELNRHDFFRYPVESSNLLKNFYSDWHPVLLAFPSCEKDALSATDCFALQHFKASIFHSMMVLELGLISMATKLKVSIKKDRHTWADIIDGGRNSGGIKGKVDERKAVLSSPPKGKTWTKRSAARERKFLSNCQSAAQEFQYFKDQWRNHIAHGRRDYGHNDARKALEHVKTFMTILATDLKLKQVKSP